MSSHLIIDGNAVYEIDEECMKRKQGKGSDRKQGGMGNNTRKERTDKRDPS